MSTTVNCGGTDTPSAVRTVGPPDVEVDVAADGGCRYVRAAECYVGSAPGSVADAKQVSAMLYADVN